MSDSSGTQKEPTSLKIRISKNNDIFKEGDKTNIEHNDMKDEIKELREEISTTRNEIMKAMGDLKKAMEKPKDIEYIKKKVYKNIRNWLDIESDQENNSSSEQNSEETKEPAIISANIPEGAQKDNNIISETELQPSNDAQTEKNRVTKTNSDTNNYNGIIKEIVIIDGPSTDDSYDKPGLSRYRPSNSNRGCIPISMIGVERKHWNSMNTLQQPRQGILTEAETPTESEKSERSRNNGNTLSSNTKLQETTRETASSATIPVRHNNNIFQTRFETSNDVANNKRVLTQTNSVISPDNNDKRRKMEMTSSNNEAKTALTEYETTERGRYQDLKDFFNEKVSMGKRYNLSDENICKVLKQTINHPFIEQQLKPCQNLNKVEGLLDKLIENQCKKCSSYRHLTSVCSKCSFCKMYGHKIDTCYTLKQHDILTQRDREQRKQR